MHVSLADKANCQVLLFYPYIPISSPCLFKALNMMTTNNFFNDQHAQRIRSHQNWHSSNIPIHYKVLLSIRKNRSPKKRTNLQSSSYLGSHKYKIPFQIKIMWLSSGSFIPSHISEILYQNIWISTSLSVSPLKSSFSLLHFQEKVWEQSMTFRRCNKIYHV